MYIKNITFYLFFVVFLSIGFTDVQAQYRVGSSGFRENWFVGAGFGAQFFYGDHNRQMYFWDRVVPAYELHAGKWFTSGLGLRLALNGLQNHGVTQNGSHGTGETYDASKWLEKQEFNYMNIHGDVMFDLMNMIEGYDYQRWHVSPYIGLGMMFTWQQPRSNEISANLGIFNTCYINEMLDFTIDLRGSMVNDRFDGEQGGRSDEGMLTMAFGIIYKINYTDWNRPRWEAPPRRGPRRAALHKAKTDSRLTDYEALKQMKDGRKELADEEIASLMLLAEPPVSL